MSTNNVNNDGSGSGSSLPPFVLALAGVSTAVATFVSFMSIFLHLKNYRKPSLQRMVVRIMIMVPIYGIASLISLFSLDAAFFIDAVRDIYEAFVIYCFFSLLLGYLGGERSLLILVHGREPKEMSFPASIFCREVDPSDPYMFLFLKRGILRTYVQVKPVLAIATMLLKALGKYSEGDLKAGSGYLYVSIVYNISICLSLYCLAMFWLCVHEDLRPYRPMPKFLCVKGILFFSFWQSLFVSILVAAGAIKRLGPYTDSEHISLALIDMLICFEMPFFAVAHMYAFSHTDYIDDDVTYAARMPVYYAFRDAFGSKDVLEDSKATLRGEGMDYREFEPAEGFIHQGSGRDNRIKAGLRYSQGGKKKYWLPMPADGSAQTVNSVIQRPGGSDQEEVYAPLFADQEVAVVRTTFDANKEFSDDRRGFELPFGDLDEEDEETYNYCKNYVFGDYNYPCIDVSSEYGRKVMWEEEERVLRDERSAFFSPIREPQKLLAGKRPSDYGTAGLKGKERDGNPGCSHPSASSTSLPSSASDSKRPPRKSNPSPASRLQPPDDGYHSPWLNSTANSSQEEVRRVNRSRQPSPSPRLEVRRHEINSDAVDLVVETDKHSISEMEEGRKRAETSAGPGRIKKVLLRGYFAAKDSDNAHQHGAESPGLQSVAHTVEDPRRDESRSVSKTPPTPVAGEREGDEDAGSLYDAHDDVPDLVVLEEAPQPGGQVFTQVAPPPFARLEGDVYKSPFDDDNNPWA